MGNELHLTASVSIVEWAGGKHDLGVVALLVLSRCSADWVHGDAIRAPQLLTRFISIRAVARSLHAPYGSIHRQVRKLIADGVLVEGVAGVAISNAPENAKAVVHVLTMAHDSLVRLIEDMSTDVCFPISSGIHPKLTSDILTAALDTWLVPFEIASSRVPDWTSGVVWLAIVVANVRHVTVDEALSELYSTNPTPDDVRLPVTVRKIVKILGLTYGTVYRHCQALAEEGLIRYDRGGWLLSYRLLDDPLIMAGVESLIQYYIRRISELTQHGLDMSAVTGCYLALRPPYVDLHTD